MFCLSFLCAARLMKNDDFSCLRIFDAVNGLQIKLLCVRFVHQFITMPLQMLQIDQYQNTLKNLNFKNHLFKGNKPRYILFVAYHLNQISFSKQIKTRKYQFRYFLLFLGTRLLKKNQLHQTTLEVKQLQDRIFQIMVR